jgi:hypothetical protein
VKVALLNSESAFCATLLCAAKQKNKNKAGKSNLATNFKNGDT